MSANFTASKEKKTVDSLFFLTVALCVGPTEISCHQQNNFPWTSVAVAWSFHHWYCDGPSQLCFVVWGQKKSSSSTKQYNTSGQQHMEIRSQIRRHRPIWSNYPSALTVNYCSYFANDTVSEQKWLWEIVDLKMNSNYNEIYLRVKNTTQQCQNCNKVWLIADTVWPTLGINFYLTICFRHWTKTIYCHTLRASNLITSLFSLFLEQFIISYYVSEHIDHLTVRCTFKSYLNNYCYILKIILTNFVNWQYILN